tara:strand:+ start:250 stop:594 length:345 start_codon:yes stop_codon:yes gene_type:complete
MYSLDGAYPVAALPFRVRRKPSGLTYTAEAVAEHLGDEDMPPWVEVRDPPVIDAQHEKLHWSGEDWYVSQIMPEPEASEILSSGTINFELSAPDGIWGISTAGLIIADEVADTI